MAAASNIPKTQTVTQELQLIARSLTAIESEHLESKRRASQVSRADTDQLSKKISQLETQYERLNARIKELDPEGTNPVIPFVEKPIEYLKKNTSDKLTAEKVARAVDNAGDSAGLLAGAGAASDADIKAAKALQQRSMFKPIAPAGVGNVAELAALTSSGKPEDAADTPTDGARVDDTKIAQKPWYRCCC